MVTCPEATLPYNRGVNLTGPGKLFAGFTHQQLIEVEEIGQVLSFDKGEAVFHEGDPGDCMYIVLRGSVSITKSTGSKQGQVLAKLGVGEFFGEMSVVDMQPRSAHAIAQEPTVLRSIRREDLRQLLIINSQIIVNLLKTFSDRLRTTNKQFIEQIVHDEKLTLVGQMANTIIHDIKNPLTIIRGQAELLERDEHSSNRYQSIIRNADHITNMANDLLDFARGGGSLKLQQVSPKAWLDEVLDLLKPMIESRNITLKTEVLTMDFLRVDPGRMTRAVYNLASNAVQAMQTGGTLTVGIARDQQGFEITVADDGPGIPEEIRDRLFDPFVTSGKKNGTGLGTSIAKKIVEDHGGQISFQTQTGIGTTFCIRLPGAVQS